MMGVPTALGVFMTYAVTSALFWHYPHLLHKRKRIKFKAAHISHRGGSAEGYENTLLAFQNAISSGTDMLELDVRLTKDEKVVVFHDPDLGRMTGDKINIADINYDHLPPFSPAVPIDTFPGCCFYDAAWTEGDRRIPLLRQVLERFPNIPMNIDIKDNNDKLIEKVSKLLDEFNRSEITVWGSFNNRVCSKCYETNPNVLLFFSAKRVLIVILLALTGILPFVPLKESHYEVFLPLSLKRRRLKQSGELTNSEKVLLWISETFLLWGPMITHLKKRGIHVYLWVCNSEEEFLLCKRIGATGIMTDFPSKLRTFLDRNVSTSAEDEDEPSS